MKIAIYSPYLDTFGGGEKYILTIAEVLSVAEEVDVLLDQHLAAVGSSLIKDKLRKFHNLNLEKVNFIKAPLGKGSFALERAWFLKDYDWLFYLTDGSIFFSTAKNSVIHFQVPFQQSSADSWWGKLKMGSWKMAIYNSVFTKKIIEENWPIKGKVVYPPVDVDKFKAGKKQKHILSIGRFFGYTRSKKHETMIQVFCSLVDKAKLKGWQLHLAGAMNEGDKGYVADLEEISKGYPIFIHTNLPQNQLIELCSKARLYWHAAGFEEKEPEKMEHFGITTVEAMAASCIPIVINLGGQKEIVDQGESGFLWNNLAELEEFTLKVSNDDALYDKLSKQAQAKAQRFSKEHFIQEINKLVYE